MALWIEDNLHCSKDSLSLYLGLVQGTLRTSPVRRLSMVSAVSLRGGFLKRSRPEAWIKWKHRTARGPWETGTWCGTFHVCLLKAFEIASLKRNHLYFISNRFALLIAHFYFFSLLGMFSYCSKLPSKDKFFSASSRVAISSLPRERAASARTYIPE